MENEDNICLSGALPFYSALLPLTLCADDELQNPLCSLVCEVNYERYWGKK